MAPVVPLVVPPTLDSHNAFLRDEPKHPVNGNCPNKPVLLHNGDAKQLISPSSLQQGPGQECLIGTVSEQVEDSRREDLNEALFSGRGGSREALGIADQELNGRRKVRWNDSHGNDLVEVWEFQPSDTLDLICPETGHTNLEVCSFRPRTGNTVELLLLGTIVNKRR